MSFPFHTGERVQMVGTGEFLTVASVNRHNVSVRMAGGEVREVTPAWLRRDPDETDPVDDVDVW